MTAVDPCVEAIGGDKKTTPIGYYLTHDLLAFVFKTMRNNYVLYLVRMRQGHDNIMLL